MLSVLPALQDKLPQLHDLCRAHRVRNLWLFGSAVGDDFDPVTSDLDFLVEFDSSVLAHRARHFFALEADLKRLFGREIDLGEPDGIRNPFLRESIEATKVPVYAAA